jgi:hypothetical protein
MWRRIAEAGLLMATAAFLSHVLYRFLVVPRLPAAPYVSTTWWIPVLAPFAIAFAIIASRAFSWWDLFISGVAAGTFIQVCRALAALLRLEGTAKSWFWESPKEVFWTLGTLEIIVQTLLVLAALYVLTRWARDLSRRAAV